MTTRLVELAVRDLGTIDRMSIVFGPGMTALTGETGAGKTMIVGAIDLLLGGRSDAALVRSGAQEALVEGRFEVDGEELVLARVVPRDGRSRAYVNGRMATAAALTEVAEPLVDLHGQHAHQSLLSGRTQREALDRFGAVDLEPLRTARAEVSALTADLASLGGDAGARAREVDLLRFQIAELDTAGLTDADEDERLDAEEDRLAGALDHRDAARAAVELLTDDDGAVDLVGRTFATLDGHGPLEDCAVRLRALQAELGEVAAEVRALGESIEDDPERLAAVRERRQLLREMRRKYGTAPGPDGTAGTGTLEDVIALAKHLAGRLTELERHDERAAELELKLTRARENERRAAADVASARRHSAGPLADAVQNHLAALAMPAARLAVDVGPVDPGDDVTFLLAANPGASPAPLAKVASGGELARAMLALRLVLSAAPPVLVFDEVDAGIGGSAALAVGRALAELGAEHQVLVVTHLPQVAAYADHQVHISKLSTADSTTTSARILEPDDRILEISRMLAGTPDSERVQEAAEELLANSARERGR
ncbi:MAG: DNA repair protein RecN [Acidimicrobiales bacterium]|nr:DNA repair protein RecN [Acidimicrobiales bacterium]